MPICGLARRIHATVKRIDGMTSGISESAKKRVLNGVLVRSLIHASVAPMANAKTAVPEANTTDVAKSDSVSLLP